MAYRYRQNDYRIDLHTTVVQQPGTVEDIRLTSAGRVRKRGPVKQNGKSLPVIDLQVAMKSHTVKTSIH